MNLLQKLCVVCSKCNEYAMELECLKYCDPNVLLAESSPFKRNALAIAYLYRRIYPEVVRQNRTQTSLLSLYLEMILKALYEDTELLDRALKEYSRRPDRMEYYRTILRLDRCDRHHTVELTFTEHVKFSVNLATLNDIERFLCKMNYVYAILSPESGLEVCSQLLQMLRRLCGVSPVACQEAYVEGMTCAQCYEELTIIPNQGRSLNKRLQGLLCNHIVVHRPSSQCDVNIQTVEQDLLELTQRIPSLSGVLTALKNLFSSSSVYHSYIQEAEEALKEYNLFTDIPARIYSLSDFTYWSRTSEVIVKRVGISIQQLNVYHHLCRVLMNTLSNHLYGEDVEDIFVVGEKALSREERLFVGSVFAAPSRIIDLITSLSIQAFEDNPVFNKLHESNEMYTKIKSLLDEIRRPAAPDGAAVEAGGGSAIRGQDPQNTSSSNGVAQDEDDDFLDYLDARTRAHNVTREVNIRKRAYLQKVSEVGYAKVIRCIKSQERLTSKLIDVNLIGTVCLDFISRLMNGFIYRTQYQEDPDVVDVSQTLSYDEHLYVVNNIIHKSLPAESLPLLGQQIYQLCNGPLFTHCTDRYPLSHNVDMAYACDNAGVLPHIKDDLVKCAEGTVHPSEWMVVKYQSFFNFSDCVDLNMLQKEMWKHVRELVLSVALYNETFGKQLTIACLRDDFTTEEDLILTYNKEWPLLLRHEGTLYKSKDLYLLLYRHLARPDEQRGVFREPDSACVPASVSRRVRASRKRPRNASLLLDLVRDQDEQELVPASLC
ncbi:DNA packaging terminase subunit 2 [Mandrillus leucophaeus cytomegalovirus]|uniref:DNA packaging terminase subunit 2 n=1 Tax=Mandrillus leucophaeus cytomegalovirus TaxID=1654930 RepID=A0A0G2UM15_9BETA|nr:DNA packaging terminase subunit 2 [Mandrillus leucophaeus cytomegalovirus]AKI29777.1 DNA packaging terminase subunit 2 [Mandrillus leucophaeus cytomegalovirus]